MIKTLLNCIDKIVSNKDLSSVYNKLYSLFDEEYAHICKIKVLDALFYENNDINIYEEIGDIYRNILNNLQESEKYYNKFLYLKNKDFYDKHSDFPNNIPESHIPLEIKREFSRLSLVAEILAFLHSRRYYKEILDNKNNFQKLYNELTYFIDNFDFSNIQKYNKDKAYDDLNNIKKELSCVLSNTENHIDINRFAIELDFENEGAYLNIIDDLVMHSNHDEALWIYNNKYITAFPNNRPFEKVIDLCWFLSDKLYFIGQYFNSIERQKLAIELELENRGKCNV